jgi:Purple acid Phosphatase, N-terminal domain/Calcineurin-like phosphoesterase
MDADNGGRIDNGANPGNGGTADNGGKADNGHDYSRRQVLSSAGLAAVAVPLVASAKSGSPRRAASLIRRSGKSGAPQPEQVHVQFGADAADSAAVSWAAPAPVARPRLRLGRPTHGHGIEVRADERTYTEALTGETVWTYHATLDGLQPGTQYVFEVLHDGATPVPGMFRTGPRGRSGGFRFTSFGDQAIPAPVGLGLGPNTPNAGFIVPAVESLDPLFHLFNGDLCYANVSDQPVATWTSFFTNNQRSAANRPWMPSAGNHENEVGNGPQGYLSYQTRFELPDNGSAEFRGNWYAFTVGSIRVISLNNDDVCLQDGAFSAFRRDHVPGYAANGDNPYINGYSSGAQRAWLERELARAQRSDDLDWIVVCMHQVGMSSAHFNGADLGIRQQWLPLFDKYGVDLVVAGHEHHFERSFPVRGVLSGSNLLTPAPQSSDTALMDTSLGTVHMIIGGGGHSAPTPGGAFDMPHDGVLITSVGAGSPQAQHPSITTTEPAPWSAYRDLQTPYGFASFDFVPHEPGGTTSITVTHYGAALGSPVYSPLDTFVMRKQVGGHQRGDRQAGATVTATKRH